MTTEEQRRRWRQVLPRMFGHLNSLTEPDSSSSSAAPRPPFPSADSLPPALLLPEELEALESLLPLDQVTPLPPSTLALVRFVRGLDRLHRLQRVGRMQVSPRTWNRTLTQIRRNIARAYHGLPAEQQTIFEGVYCVAITHQGLVDGAELQRLIESNPLLRSQLQLAMGQLSRQPSLMPLASRRVLQRYSDAIHAYTFLRYPLQLDSSAFGVTAESQRWTLERARQLKYQLDAALAEMKLHGEIPSRLMALQDAFAFLAAVRSFPLPKRLDPTGGRQLQLMDEQKQRVRRSYLVSLSERERGWMREEYKEAMRDRKKATGEEVRLPL